MQKRGHTTSLCLWVLSRGGNFVRDGRICHVCLSRHILITVRIWYINEYGKLWEKVGSIVVIYSYIISWIAALFIIVGLQRKREGGGRKRETKKMSHKWLDTLESGDEFQRQHQQQHHQHPASIINSLITHRHHRCHQPPIPHQSPPSTNHHPSPSPPLPPHHRIERIQNGAVI